MASAVPQYDATLLHANTLEELDAWVAAGGDPAEMVRIAESRLNWPNIPTIRAWLLRQSDRRQDEHFKLAERSTGAAEVSARAAQTSARSAAIAVAVSLLALVLSAVAYWKPIDPAPAVAKAATAPTPPVTSASAPRQ